MTDSVKIYEFLLGQRPICSQFPFKQEMGDNYAKLRLKYKHEYGFDIMAGKCSNVFNCVGMDLGCIGRPIPKDDNIKSYFENINVEITESTHKGKDVYLVKSIVACSGCPFKASCENTCPTQQNYIERSIKPTQDAMQQDLMDYDHWESTGRQLRMLTYDDIEESEIGDWANESLPWDCLSSRQRECLHLSMYGGMTQGDIAYKLGISREAVSKHTILATSKLREWGLARKMIESYGAPLRVIRYYIHNMKHQEIADLEGTSRTSVTMSINKWKSKCL